MPWPWQAVPKAGKVVLVSGPWIEEFLDEITPFRNDDRVDAVSLAVHMLEKRKNKAWAF